MKIGYAEKEITPTKTVQLSGYSDDQVSIGVHDPLMLRILVIRTQPRDTILVQTDLMGIDKSIVDRLAKRLKTKRNNIMICCTHTHSGPTGTATIEGMESIFGKLDEDYIELWLEKAVNAYMMAQLTSSEATIRYGRVEASGIATDRHDGSKGDDRLSVIEFELANGSKILLYNFSCHPTIMNGKNLYISADLPYGVLKSLRDRYKGMMFINGSAGDISTRFTRRESSFAEVEAKGELLADFIEKALASAEFEPIKDVQILQEELPIAIKPVPNVEEIKEKLAQQKQLVEEAKRRGASEVEVRVLYSKVEGYNSMINSVQVLKELEGLTLTVTYFKINAHIFVGVPVELFSKLSNPYRLQNENLHYVSYCNGYYMYMCDKAAYDNNYYEAGSSLFEKGEGEKFMERIYQKITELNW